LKNLATGSGAYDQAYKDAMERISSQIKDQEELAKQVLSWITCAKRPLTTSELQHALAVEIGEPQLDKDNIPEVEDIVSVCGGLVTIDEESEIIRLVHYTTQEYFERTQKQWFPDAQTNITMICVTYLSFDVFRSGICQSDDEFEERLRSNQLYRYAARNWGHHARKALYLSEGVSLEKEDKAKFEATIQAVLDFLMRTTEVEAASQALIAKKRRPNDLKYSQEIPRHQTGLHLAAYFGVKVIVQLLLELGADVTAADPNRWTPLHSACSSGHLEVVQLLLEKGVDVDAKDKLRRTPLFYAAEEGNKAIIELLLATNRVDVDSLDHHNWTPVSMAAKMGHKDVLALLLNQSHNWNAQNTFGQTPLWWARRNGYPEIADFLFEKCKEKGIIIQEDDLPAMKIPSDNRIKICDVCEVGISDKDIYYHCTVCDSGDFDICEDCFVGEAHCLDQSHTLIKERNRESV